MSGELGLRKKVLEILNRAGLDAQPVENMTRIGCPDVECILGWIELKKTKEWPSRDTTKVRLDHDLSKGQRIWLRRRAKKGGNAWVLIQIDQDFLLLKGDVAAYLVGESTRSELEEGSIGVCKGLKELKTKLVEWLRA
jgi:hypothetical protein